MATSAQSQSRRPQGFGPLLAEMGGILLTIAVWAHNQGTLLNQSWGPVGVMALAGVLFGLVKSFVIIPDRERATKAGKAAMVAHWVKTSVCAFGCAVAAIALAG